jgi:tetratricopeptide (TPR) repeat protein
VWSVAVSPDGRTIASGGADGVVRLWDLAGWKPGEPQPPVGDLTGHTATVYSVAYSPDGKLLTSASQDGAIRLQDAATGKTVRTIQGPAVKDQASEIAFSADGKILAAGAEDGSVRLWDVASGEKQSPLRWHNRHVSSLAFGPDNRFLASAGLHDRKVHLTDRRTLRRVQTLGPPGAGEAEMKVAFGGDGRTLAYGGWDDTIRLWDLVEKKETTLFGLGPNLDGLAVDPTGRFVAATCGGALRFWDRSTPTRLRVIGPLGAARHVTFTPEGRYLVVAGFNGTVSILRTPPYHPAPKRPASGSKQPAVAAPGKGKTDDALAGLRKASELNPKDAGALDKLGVALYRIGRMDEAAACFRKIIALDPKNAFAHGNLGLALHARGKVDEAVASYLQALELNPMLSWVHASLRYALRGRGQVEGPIPGYPKAIEIDPKDAGALDKLGVALAGKGQFDEAIACYRQAIALDPKNAGAHGNLGVAFLNKDQVDDAIASFRKALGLQPKNAGIHLVLGLALKAKGQAASSTACYNKAIALDPNLARAHSNLSAALQGKGKTDEAVAGYRKAIELAPNLKDSPQLAVMLAQLGMALLERKHWAAAEPFLRECLAIREKKQPDDWRTFNAQSMLGGVLLGRHQYAEAGRLLLKGYQGMKEREKTIPPQGKVRLTEAVERLVQLYQTTARKDEAAKWQTQLRKLKQQALPGDTSRLLQSGAPPMLQAAALQAWLGQNKELAATRARALEVARDTKDPTTAERVAKICSLSRADARTHEAALVLARRAVELGKGHGYMVYFRMALGMAEYRSGHYPAADAALLTASKLGARNSYVSGTTAFYRAMSLFRQGKEAEARKLAAEAAARMKPLPTDEKAPLAAGANADDLILWLAYKEAKALIRFDAAPAAKAKNDKK